MENIFVELALILFAAFVVSYIIKFFKQPMIVGYILAGVLISPFLIILGGSTSILGIFSEFGIAFLLFIVGLHLNPKVIKEIGFSSLVIGLGQVLATFGASFLISRYLLGFGFMASVYFGVALAFSSTIIVMKLLSDKKQLDSLFGKISIGVLIVQDLIAIGILMFVSSVALSGNKGGFGFVGLLTGLTLIALFFLFGHYILPKILRKIAKSQELLFLFSICWCFILAAFFSYLGFSMEIGALIAGVILSVSPYATEISAKIRPLRDFFLILFFVILGLKIQLSNIGAVIVDALIFSLVVLILKPFFLMIFMKLFGYTKRTSFFVGTTLAQVSEFSLIVLGLGIAVGNILPSELNMVVLTMIITILFSSYMIVYADKIYRKLSPFLKFFEKKNIRKRNKIKMGYDTILFGYNRVGYNILNVLKKIGKHYLVVDFNPDIIKKLNEFNIPALYGDVYDLEFLEDLNLKKLELIISTIPDLESNMLLLKSIKEVNRHAIIILRAQDVEDSLKLYGAGANYVLTPHFIGGEYISKMIKHSKSGDEDYSIERKKHIRMLKEILNNGHKISKIKKDKILKDDFTRYLKG